MKRKIFMIINQFFFVCLVALFFIIVACGYKRTLITTEDISAARSIQAVHLVSKYNTNKVISKHVKSFNEVLLYGKDMPVIFEGIMTGYGPDCEGCGGKVGCPPRQNVKNGNIYFNDQEYGKINIVATDKRIPCGSIIKIKNSNIAKEVIAIALDRGGAIKETKMDFLVNSEDESARKIGVQKVIYEIVRWGW